LVEEKTFLSGEDEVLNLRVLEDVENDVEY
jgi:hypothetical protein